MDQNNSPAKWHVVYTMPRSEKIVAAKIADMGLESFLPLHTVVRQWSDRKKKLEVPLFPNYVFLRVNAIDRVSVLSIRELVKFVAIERKPATVRDKEISLIKKILSEDVDVSDEKYFVEGMKVRIGFGQFAGLEGVIIKRNGKARIVIRVEGLEKAFSFNVSTKFAEILNVPGCLGV